MRGVIAGRVLLPFLLVAVPVLARDDANAKRCKDKGGTWIVEWKGRKPVGVCYGGNGGGRLFECRSLLDCTPLGGDEPFVPRARSAPTRSPKPDLRVAAVLSPQWVSRCEADGNLFWLVVHVQNDGDAAVERARITLEARDQHAVGGVSWVSSKSLDPYDRPGAQLMPGSRHPFAVFVPFFASNPYHMFDEAPHPFRVTIDPTGGIPEENEENNTWQVQVPKPPMSCPLPPAIDPPGGRTPPPVRDGKWPETPGESRRP